MSRKGYVFMHQQYCGVIEETEKGYTFTYEESYVLQPKSMAISKTLPLTLKSYQSNVMFPFFDGLIPEGWLLDIVERNWKINERDRMGLLLACCNNCIGAVSVSSSKINNN